MRKHIVIWVLAFGLLAATAPSAARDEFDCNANLCDLYNPCNVGCSCTYPAGVPVGYCRPWYQPPPQCTTLDKDSTEYIVAAILVIVSNWNKQELIERASPELLSTFKDNDLDKLFGQYQKLGNLKMYKGAKISVTAQHIKDFSVSYIAEADFDAGQAEIEISLIKHSGIWQIGSFDIHSKVFMDQP